MAADHNADQNRAQTYQVVRRDMESTMLSNSEVYADQVRWMEKIYGDTEPGAELDQLTRILIAFGMAMVSGAESSVEWTITRALNHGATEKMLSEAIDVALLNGGTFAVQRARFAMNTIALRRVSAARSGHRFTADVGDPART